MSIEFLISVALCIIFIAGFSQIAWEARPKYMHIILAALLMPTMIVLTFFVAPYYLGKKLGRLIFYEDDN